MFSEPLNIFGLFVIVFLIDFLNFYFHVAISVLFSFFYLYCFFSLYLLHVLVNDDLYNFNHNMVASIDHTFEIYKRPSK